MGHGSAYEAPDGAIRKETHGYAKASHQNLLLALIYEHLELVTAVVVFAVWKGPAWGLDVLALERAWENAVSGALLAETVRRAPAGAGLSSGCLALRDM